MKRGRSGGVWQGAYASHPPLVGARPQDLKLVGRIRFERMTPRVKTGSSGQAELTTQKTRVDFSRTYWMNMVGPLGLEPRTVNLKGCYSAN